MATYYMRADGTANQAGAVGPDTNAAACMNAITYLYLSTFSPGDTIYVSDKGGVYRTQINCTQSGSTGSPISQIAIGTPVFDGGEVVTGWTNYGGDVWQATLTANPADNIWIDGVLGDEEASIVALTAEYDWYWESNVLYLYSPGGDPDSAYTEIVVPTRYYALQMVNVEFVVFDGIEIRNAIWNGVHFNYSSGGQADGIVFRNIRSHHNLENGMHGNGESGNEVINLLVEDSRFDHNGRSGLQTGGYFLDFTYRRCTGDHNGRDPAKEWAAGIKAVNGPGVGEGWVSYGGLVDQCLAYANGKDDDDSVIQNAAGIWFDTIGSNSGSNPCVIRHSISRDNSAEGLYCENNHGSRWYGNLSYGNGGIGMWAACSVTIYPNQNNLFYNNTVYGNNIGIQCSGNWGVTGTETAIDNLFRNNISSGNTSRELKVLAGAENVHGANGWGSGNVYNANCLGVEAADFIEWALTGYATYDAWLAVSSQTDNNVEADPVFTNAAGYDYTLAPSSPCVDAGVDLGDSYDDGLDPVSTWPSAVATLDQDNHGTGWEIGAYVYEDLNSDDLTASAITSGAPVLGTPSLAGGAASSVARSAALLCYFN